MPSSSYLQAAFKLASSTTSGTPASLPPSAPPAPPSAGAASSPTVGPASVAALAAKLDGLCAKAAEAADLLLLPEYAPVELGAYVGRVHYATAPSNETAIELFYAAKITPAVTITPDIQFLLDPGGDDTVKDPIVFTVRLQVAF